MKKLFFTTYSDIIQSCLAIMFAVFYMVIILVNIYVNFVKKKKVREEYIRKNKTIGLFFENLKLHNKGTQHNLWYMMVRLISLNLYVFLFDHPYFQTVIILICVLLFEVYMLRVKPFTNKLENYSSIVNNACTMLLCH